jgi:predicted GTPase
MFVVSRVDELNENIQDHFDVFGNLLVQTVDLARAQYFLKYASLAKVNVLLSGLTGSSKSFLLDAFISGLGSSQHNDEDEDEDVLNLHSSVFL